MAAPADLEGQQQQDSSRAPTLHDEPAMEDTQRHGINSPTWHGRRGLVIKVLTGVMVAILVVFLADLSWLFGSTFKVGDRVSALKILVVDYDGGAVGESVANAYKSFEDKTFPTFEFRSADDFPQTSDVKHGVCHADYWGAIYINKGSSDRLAAAYKGGSAAENYNPADSMTYIYNGARYPTVVSGYVMPNLQKIIGASRGGYYQTKDGRSALRSVNTTDPAAVEAYLNPISSTPDIIMPTNQGSRNLYNTINIVMAILGQFFYVLAMNGVYEKFGLTKNMRIRDVFIMRLINGTIFSMFFAIVVTGYIWAFREDWGVTAGQWALTWLTFWLFMDVNFQVLETLVGAFVPLAAMPFFLLTWFMTNVASVVFPFELTAGFYRIGYIFPANSLWAILIQVWSGCGNSLHIALPVLFAWFVVGHVTAYFGVRKRCMDLLENQAIVEGKQQ